MADIIFDAVLAEMPDATPAQQARQYLIEEVREMVTCTLHGAARAVDEGIRNPGPMAQRYPELVARFAARKG